MSFLKIPSILMYVIVGITILIMGLFYFADSLVDAKEYQQKLNKIESPSGRSSEANILQDLQSADSLAAQTDSSLTAGITETVTSVSSAVSTESLSFKEKIVFNKTDLPLVWGYILLAIAALLALIFPLIYALTNPANIVRSLLVLVGIAILIGLAYLLASDTPIRIPGYLGTDNSNPAVLKVIDTGLIFMYFMLGLTLLSILYAEVVKYFK